MRRKTIFHQYMKQTAQFVCIFTLPVMVGLDMGSVFRGELSLCSNAVTALLLFI